MRRPNDGLWLRVSVALAAVTCLIVPALSGAANDGQPYDADTAFSALKSLEGTWTGTVGPAGEPAESETTIVYRVSANGHSVIETFSPGTAYEMFSVYYRDGDQLKMTHYCAIGNQPHMRFEPSGSANEISFAFDGGTNLDPATDAHAHEGSLRILSADEIETTAIGWAGGKPASERVFKLRRQAN